ncbi:hypothetical protein [Nocardia sp. NPDC127526]|uniref:hypothetical protein n=1 Tax=Nocardia sp. NPDC127526 TaxID=3345393 RepID=UPI003639397E
MAYLHSKVETYGHDTEGVGWLELSWFNVKVNVETLEADDSRGDIAIRWNRAINNGVSACLRLDEAQVLHRQLANAIATFTGIDNDVDTPVTVNVDGIAVTPNRALSFCEECNGRIGLMHNGTERWWTHEPYSINDHEPVLATAALCAICGEWIDLLTRDGEQWWSHELYSSDHDAIPEIPAEVAS